MQAQLPDQRTTSCCLQIIFFDLRKVVLDDLYKHHVKTARIQILLISIDEALGNVCAAAADSLHAYLAKGLLQAVVIAMQRVLLDGGPNRCALLRSYQPDSRALGGFAACC